MNTEHDVTPMLEMRKRLDASIEALLEKTAAMRKKRDALNTAIEILRSNDDELIDYAPKQPKRSYKFDEDECEKKVLGYLSNGSGRLSFTDLIGRLKQENFNFTVAGLRRVVSTSPKIVREGVKEQTRYCLVRE